MIIARAGHEFAGWREILRGIVPRKLSSRSGLICQAEGLHDGVM